MTFKEELNLRCKRMHYIYITGEAGVYLCVYVGRYLSLVNPKWVGIAAMVHSLIALSDRVTAISNKVILRQRALAPVRDL